MALRIKLRKRQILQDPVYDDYIVVSLMVLGGRQRQTPMMRVVTDQGTQTSWEPPAASVVYGPPNRDDLFTKNDPHFMAYIRENGINTVEKMLEAANVFTDLLH